MRFSNRIALTTITTALILTAGVSLAATPNAPSAGNANPGGPAPGSGSGGPDAATLAEAARRRAAEVVVSSKTVLAVDRAHFNDWQHGDFDKFGAAVTDDFVGIDGNGAPGKQIMSKADYMTYGRAQRPAPSIQLSDTTARLFGFEADVAVLQGVLTDTAPPGRTASSGAGSGAGEIYSAIYIKDILDGSWQMARWIISPLQVSFTPPAIPPGPQWSLDMFSVTQARVIRVVHDFFTELDNHDINGMQRTLDDTYVEIHGNGDRQFGQQMFIVSKSLSGGFPGLIGMEKPDVQFYGNYGDVAVVQGIRRDSNAGSVYGTDFAPQWRNVVHYIAVLQRSCAASVGSCQRMGKDPNEWRMELYHATYIHTPGDAAAAAERQAAGSGARGDVGAVNPLR